MKNLTKEQIQLLKFCVQCTVNYSTISKKDIRKARYIIKKLQTKND